jgi:type I restriction enzyme M protein
VDTEGKIKSAKAELESKVIAKYSKLSIDEIKIIVVQKKWAEAIELRIKIEMDNISHKLTGRIKELADRYGIPLPKLNFELDTLTSKVENHLEKMTTFCQ